MGDAEEEEVGRLMKMGNKEELGRFGKWKSVKGRRN